MGIDVFLSHSHHDRVLASQLVNLLITGAQLTPNKIRCTSDLRTPLAGGKRIAQALRRDLENARVFMPVLTADSVVSAWVGSEIGAAWGLEQEMWPVRSGRVRVPPLLSDFVVLDLGNPGDVLKLTRQILGKIWSDLNQADFAQADAAARSFSDWYAATIKRTARDPKSAARTARGS